MKSYNAAAAPTLAKRRRALAVAVFVLVFVSLLVPLAFLLGLHNRSGYFGDERSQSVGFENYRHVENDQPVEKIQEKNSKEGQESRIEELVKKFAPSLPKDVKSSSTPQIDEHSNDKIDTTSKHDKKSDSSEDAISHSELKKPIPSSKGPPSEQEVVPRPPMSRKERVEGPKESTAADVTTDENLSFCEREFGSYCLWSVQHKEVMQDDIVKRLKDQLFVARAYYPSIAKLQGKEQLTRDVKANIQEYEKMLSDAISDPDLPLHVTEKIAKMDEVIAKAKSCSVDCNNIDRKFRQLVDLTEDEAHFHMKQSAFLYQLGVQTMSKSFHCLSMRLTVEYFRSSQMDVEQSFADKLENPDLQHYIIFSSNVLAVSVTINSTVMNSEDANNMVFHVVTDKQNFYSMKNWFYRNLYKEATISVLNFDDLNPNNVKNVGQAQLSPSEEFRVSIRKGQPSTVMKTEYVSVFGRSHFLLPEIFKNLKKVIVLDDDVVVRGDLQSLWNIDLGGKFIAAVEHCGVRLRQLSNYLGSNSYNGDACVWMSGLNIIDLDKWRERDVSKRYQSFLKELQSNDESWGAAVLPASLLTFDNHIYALDHTWFQSGLGYDYGVDEDDIKNAIVVHYNGNMKPWLDLGIPEYKKFWKKYLTPGERFMDECNVIL